MYIKPEITQGSRTKVGFLGYEMKTGKSVPITKWTYLRTKLGPAYKEIALQLKDYVTCEAATLANNHTVILFPDGDLGIFGAKGSAISTGKLTYKGEAVRSVAAVGNDFWSAVPTLNAVVCYSTGESRINMRIGGEKSNAFLHPEDVVKYDERLFVCCSESCKVRTIALSDYSVNDYLTFEEPVRKYFIAGNEEFVQLDSGIYILDA